MTELTFGVVFWGITIFAVQMVVLAFVIRWSVRGAIEDAAESIRHDIRVVLEEMERRRRRDRASG
jgi:cell division protein FtsX